MLRFAKQVSVLAALALGCSEQTRDGAARQALDAKPERVLVLFTDSGGAPAQRAAAIEARRRKILATLPPGSFELRRAYGSIPGFAGAARPEALAALRRNPEVTVIEADETGQTNLAQSGPLVKAPAARATHGVTGAGVNVAVLDTGAALGHSDLAGAIVAQHCFTGGDCQPGNVNTSSTADDFNGHGTNVSGIITGDGAIAPIGIAPGTGIVAVQVISRNNTGQLSDWVAGLDWVYQNNAALNVRVINMSIGSGVLYTGNCDSSQQTMAMALANLRDAGVVVFASSGNDGSNTKLRSPACNSGVISVGALYDTNAGRAPDTDGGTWRDQFGASFGACFDAVSSPTQLTCFTNAGPDLDLVAPGCWITAAYPPNTTDYYCGTSQSSPTVAAIAALAIQKRPSLTPFEVERLLKMTAVNLFDVRTNRNYRSVDALAALDELAKRDCTGKANGTLCSDANACTTGEVCQGGVCAPGATVVMCTSNSCGAMGTCDTVLGCVVQPAVNGSPCNDNNACTMTDVCVGGLCKGTARVCFPATGCLTAAMCNPVTGNCGAQAAQPDGTSCFDNNPCTTLDRCAEGTCKGDPVVCPATGCREAGVCEGVGACALGAVKPDQTACGQDAVCLKGTCAKVTVAVSEVLGPVAPTGCSSGPGAPLLALGCLGLRLARARKRVS